MTHVAAPALRRSPRDRVRPLKAALLTEWREVGGLGRLGVIGVVLSAVVAVALGLWIEGSVRHHLLEVRTELIDRVVDDLAADGLLPPTRGATGGTAALDAAIEHRLIGGEIVGVAIRDSAGETVYDAAETGGTAPAWGGDTPHVEQHGDGLMHFVLPIEISDRGFVGTFEVFQRAGSFDAVLAGVRRNLWLAIFTGLASLGLAMAAFTVSHAQATDRRRRHAERLLSDLLRAEDQERRRIVGALHDDVGQPLYRLLYGLEGCRARIREDPQIAGELQRLSGLVRDIDQTLRAELHQLHRTGLETLDMASALYALAEECREESGMAVVTAVDLQRDPPPATRAVILRAVQEALLNARKHAAASTVRIIARGDDRHVAIEVSDDGRGTDGRFGLGLTTTSERLQTIGGRLTVGLGEQGGTVLRFWVPVEEAQR